ncbi:MAG TPA: hypothetical protein VND64_05395 [Pirellulales bacterium]|nr:hypothetical protein [Pirellulales bacterium]
MDNASELPPPDPLETPAATPYGSPDRSLSPSATTLASGARGLVRFLYNHNPFYVVSALLICHGLRVSFLDTPGRFQTRSMIAGLMGFTVLLAVMAWLVIRLGKVWNDARTLLVLVILMFVAISVSCDYSLAESLAGINADGIVNFLAGFAFALVVSEGLLRGLGIRLPILYRGPYYLFLALFFIYPVAISPLMVRNGNRWLPWALFGFSPAAGIAWLALLPAVRRGPDYGRPNGTPWPWPWFPWTLFVVLAVAVGIRAYSMLLSFHTVAGGDSIFRPYFLVPFLWAVGLVLLEIGLATRSRWPRALALAVPVVLLALAALNGSSSFVHRQFMADFEQLLGGSPLFLSLVAVVAFYALATARRVPAAYDLLTLAICGLTVIGPHTHDLLELTAPKALPLLAGALLQVWPALARFDSRRWFLAGVGALAAATVQFQGTWFTAHDGFIPCHLLLLIVLAVGAWSRDAWARAWQNLAAVALGLLAVAWSQAAWHPALTAELPSAAVLAYPVVMAIVAWGYGRLTHNHFYDVAAAIHTIALAAFAGSHAWVWSRQELPGFDYIAWGMACFALAALISLLKTGVPQRWWARRYDARPPVI